jgi:hypothetical protein
MGYETCCFLAPRSLPVSFSRAARTRQGADIQRAEEFLEDRKPSATALIACVSKAVDASSEQWGLGGSAVGGGFRQSASVRLLYVFDAFHDDGSLVLYDAVELDWVLFESFMEW